MNISKHISTLLKFNECVVIPDFGGFISNYVPAKFDHKRNAFMPPSKEIVFNSKISKNDGLLINQLVEAEGIGYHDAQMMIANWVEDALKALNHGEKIELEGVGSIEFDRNGSFAFHSVNENFLVDAYGLKEFSFPKASRSIYTESYQPRPAIKATGIGKNAVKIAASIAILLALSIFPLKKENFKFLSSTVNPLTTITEETTVPEVTEVVEEVKVSEPEVAETVTKVQGGNYILVGGSFQKSANALAFKEELRNEGHNPEIFELKNGMFKVAIDSYASRQEALDAMNLYRESHPGSQAWVGTR